MARRFQIMYNNISDANLRTVIESGQVRNLPITLEHVTAANNIFGPNENSMDNLQAEVDAYQAPLAEPEVSHQSIFPRFGPSIMKLLKERSVLQANI